MMDITELRKLIADLDLTNTRDEDENGRYLSRDTIMAAAPEILERFDELVDSGRDRIGADSPGLNPTDEECLCLALEIHSGGWWVQGDRWWEHKL